ncbi:MAG: dihydropteridine reductase [Clostridiales bacterium]|nr:dihydropteridine reductase [Clostridiales bacterium]
MNTDKIYAEQIANEYAAKEASKVKALKRLDAKAKNPANIFTYTFGVVSSLVLGVGMCLAMGVIGGGTALMMGLGIAVGCVGIVGVGVNYPLYKKILTRSKSKYAADIIKLATEIANEE